MDPNVTLETIRELIKTANERPLTGDEVSALLNRIEDMDNWLKRGGFPPADWA